MIVLTSGPINDKCIYNIIPSQAAKFCFAGFYNILDSESSLISEHHPSHSSCEEKGLSRIFSSKAKNMVLNSIYVLVMIP